MHSLCDDEWNEMTEMHRLGRWASAGVEIKWLSLLIESKKCVQVAMGEENSSSDEVMCRLLDGLFKTFNKRVIDRLTAKSLDQLFIVDS
jgi:hypothetical protein